MADKKISQLTDGNPAQTNDQIPVNRGGTNFRITAGSIVSLAPSGSSTTQVLFNNAGVVSGDAQFTFNPTGDVLTLTGQYNIDNLRMDGNVLSSTNTNGNIDLTPNGTGRTNITNLTSTSPRFVTSINDTNGNELFLLTATASAVNEVTVTNGAVGTGPTLAASGNDTNINLRLAPKGTGQVQELVSATYYSLASQYDVGTAPNQIPLNQYLGTMAFQDSTGVSMTLAGFGAGTAAAPSLIPNGDPNTGFWFPAADTIAASTAGSERLRIDSSGNLGIGTSSPGYKLDVSGTGNFGGANPTLYIQPTTNTNNALMRCVNAGGTAYVGLDNNAAGLTANYALNLYHSGAYPINFSTNGTLRATIDSSGNLGLGVTPSAWRAATRGFDVGAAGFVAANQTGVVSINVGSNAYLNSSDTWIYKTTAAATLYQTTLGEHRFYTAASGTINTAVSFTQAMTLDSGASNDRTNLLIGTTTSAYQTASRGLIEVNGSSTALIAIKSGDTARGYFAAGSTATELAAVGASQPLLFTTNSAERARITSGGDLLVGTSTAVNARLQVDSGSSGLYGYFNSTNANGGYVSFASSGTAHGDIGTAAQVVSGGATTDFGINARGSRNLIFGTNNTERARITSGGDLLVGTTSNTNNYKCNFQFSGASVNGLIVLNNSSTGAPQLLFLYDSAQTVNNTEASSSYEDTTAQRWALRKNGGLANYQSNNVDLSDARTKNSVTPAASMWDKIGALEIVTYKYNDQTHDDVNVGVIAQQVEAVEPVWVDADGFGETPEDGVPLKTVYTKDITFAAIKALQEAMSRIEALEAKVAALESN